MKVLHLLVSGNTGGIEVLLRNSCKLSIHENHYAFLWCGGQIYQEMTDSGVKTVLFDMDSDGVLKTLHSVVRYCRENNIDTVISHNSAPLLKIALVLIKLLIKDVKVIAYAHANAVDICEASRKRGVGLRRAVHKIGFAVADGIIAISESVKQSLVDYLNISSEKVTVIHNGVPFEYCCLSEHDTDSPVRFIYTGRLIEEKGVQITLDALAQLSGRLDFEFTVIGDGNYREQLEKQTAQLGLTGHVRFMGTSREVIAYLKKSDIFIHMPVWKEGFGITIIEALSVGCVCVCAGKGGIPEIITDKVNGYLVNSGTADELAELLLKIVPAYREGKCEQLRENALVRAQDFSIEKYITQIDEYILSVHDK